MSNPEYVNVPCVNTLIRAEIMQSLQEEVESWDSLSEADREGMEYLKFLMNLGTEEEILAAYITALDKIAALDRILTPLAPRH